MNTKKNWVKVLALALALIMIVGVVPTVGAEKAPKNANLSFRFVDILAKDAKEAYVGGTGTIDLQLQVKDGTNDWVNMATPFAADATEENVKLTAGQTLGALNAMTAIKAGGYVATFTSQAANKGIAKVQYEYKYQVNGATQTTKSAEFPIIVNQEPVIVAPDGFAGYAKKTDSVTFGKKGAVAADTNFANNFDFTWSVVDAGTSTVATAASIDANGKLTFKDGAANGQAFEVLLNAKQKGGALYQATSTSIVVNVSDSAPALNIAVVDSNTSTGDIIVNGTEAVLVADAKVGDAVATASNAAWKIEWKTGNKDIISFVDKTGVDTISVDGPANAPIVAPVNVKANKVGIATVSATFKQDSSIYNNLTKTFTIKVAEVAFNPSEDMNIFYGASFNIDPTVTVGEENWTAKSAVNAAAANTSILSIENNKKVTGIAAGSSNLTVNVSFSTTVNGTVKTLNVAKTIKVTVASKAGSLTVDKSEVSLMKDETVVVTPSLVIDGIDQSKYVNWTSDKTTVATVSKDVNTGAVTIKAVADKGEAKVTATYKVDSTELKATVKVNVVDTKITFVKDYNRYVAKNGKLEDLEIAIKTTASPSTVGTLTWSVVPSKADSKVVATVTADPTNPLKATLEVGNVSGWVKVKVVDAGSKAEVTSKHFYVVSKYFSMDKTELTVGDVSNIKFVTYPAFLGNAANVTWVSNRDDRATVEGGKVTALKAGSVWIIAANSNLQWVKASKQFIIKAAAE